MATGDFPSYPSPMTPAESARAWKTLVEGRSLSDRVLRLRDRYGRPLVSQEPPAAQLPSSESLYEECIAAGQAPSAEIVTISKALLDDLIGLREEAIRERDVARQAQQYAEANYTAIQEADRRHQAMMGSDRGIPLSVGWHWMANGPDPVTAGLPTPADPSAFPARALRSFSQQTGVRTRLG